MATSIWEHFSTLPDPRVDRTKLHKLEDILTIATCAVICGAETWVDVADFGLAKESWLLTFLELPNGIPSHDTFDRAGGKAAIHLVSAWVHENHAVFGQLRVEDKSNEITAIPNLLEMLNLKQSTVTIDAIGCQKEIARKVLDDQTDRLAVQPSRLAGATEHRRGGAESLARGERIALVAGCLLWRGSQSCANPQCC